MLDWPAQIKCIIINRLREGNKVVIESDKWYTWNELKTRLPASFPSDQALDNGPIDKNSSQDVLDFEIAARIDWNNSNLPNLLEFTLGGSRLYQVAISKAAPANEAPTVTNPTITVNQGISATGALGADADGNITNVTIGSSTYGTLTPSFNGSSASYSFTANTTPSLKGLKTETVNYSITDGTETTNGTVSIQVTFADDAPTGSVTATGTSKVGQVLTAIDTISDVDDGGSGVAKTYEWQQYNTATNSWEAIAGRSHQV